MNFITYVNYSINPISKIGNKNNLNSKFCLEYKKLSPIIQAYSKITFPVVGAPGIAMNNGSVLENVCNYLEEHQEPEIYNNSKKNT